MISPIFLMLVAALSISDANEGFGVVSSSLLSLAESAQETRSFQIVLLKI